MATFSGINRSEKSNMVSSKFFLNTTISLLAGAEMVHKLRCSVQNYSWGKVGNGSLVAALAVDGQHIADVDCQMPYSEFWMGTHPNGPSSIGGKPLSEVLASNPALLGAHEQGGLLYLFKVLSVAGPLSIQIHPTKEQAKLLHAKDPKNYPDANHKPEIAIALTKFELLSGFRRHANIAHNLQEFPEVFELLEENERKSVSALAENPNPVELRKVFARVWEADPTRISAVVNKISARLENDDRTDLNNIVAKLAKLYPGDVGVLAPIFLNYFQLQPGEATFLSANVPHAYLFGDCIECMACSDNTIRAGLTPKFIDVESAELGISFHFIRSLVNMLNYSETLQPKLSPRKAADGTLLFTPGNINEFWVQKLEKVKSDSKNLSFAESSSIIIVISGSANLYSEVGPVSIAKGEVVFVSAQSGPAIKKASDDFVAYRAFTPSPQAMKSI